MALSRLCFMVGCFLFLGGCHAPAQQGGYKLVEAFPSLEFDDPVELTSAGDSSGRIFVVSQKGTIHVVDGNVNQTKPPVFLDIKSRLESGGEKGLLGLAFHPEFANNGYLYVNYTKGNPLETIIARYTVSAPGANTADPNSEMIILRFTQPFANHNGGKLCFGNDGLLYIAVGDGGSGGDPGNRAQDKKELLGKILRIDVNRFPGGRNYAIPPDNPFAGNTDGFREEIFAYGMRNPWRMNFDRESGYLWAGDVGQNKVEEVDIIEKGGNYGWRVMEGNQTYDAGDNSGISGMTPPVWSYRQGSESGRSVTGGFVCRDPALPALHGKYIYGDFVSGNVWALTVEGKRALKNELIATVRGGLSSFGEDGKNRLYLLSYGTGKVFFLSPVH